MSTDDTEPLEEQAGPISGKSIFAELQSRGVAQAIIDLLAEVNDQRPLLMPNPIRRREPYVVTSQNVQGAVFIGTRRLSIAVAPSSASLAESLYAFELHRIGYPTVYVQVPAGILEDLRLRRAARALIDESLTRSETLPRQPAKKRGRSRSD